MTTPTRVFISYSHDSSEHKVKVLELANRLRRDGVDANLDRYVDFPEEGWPRWMRSQIEEADAVLIICSAIYKRRFDGDESPGKGLGARWEGLILTQSLYDDLAQNKGRFVPVLLDDTPDAAIPSVLRPFTYFRIPDQYEQLYRLITKQPAVVGPPIGSIRQLPADIGLPASPTPPRPVVSAGAHGGSSGSSTTEIAPRGERPDAYAQSAATDRALEALQEAWRAERLTLMVGAGVSAAVGVPLWAELIAHLLGAYVERTYASVLSPEAVDAIRSTLQDELRSLSPIQTAEFIQSRLTALEFKEVLRAGIYGGGPHDAPSALLRAIVALHRGLHGIVSFNFDDILERAFDDAGVLHTTIASGRDLSAVKGLPIYHPHGYLPRVGNGSDNIVFAESQYHSQYAGSYSWTNVVVQRLLLESTCLFVGTSLTDPNLRRMIDLSHRENDAQRHFYVAKLPRANRTESQAAVLEVYQAAHEALGITPIWVDAYDEIPALLRAIKD